jgi:hypothetical protein
MSAWGISTFENDDAVDWTYELEESENLGLVVDSLNAVADAEDTGLDARLCARGLAAAEVVAELTREQTTVGTRPPKGGRLHLPAEVIAWISDRPQLNARAYTALAAEVVQRVRSNSELQAHWIEAGNAAEWQAELEGLAARLRAAG